MHRQRQKNEGQAPRLRLRFRVSQPANCAAMTTRARCLREARRDSSGGHGVRVPAAVAPRVWRLVSGLSDAMPPSSGYPLDPSFCLCQCRAVPACRAAAAAAAGCCGLLAAVSARLGREASSAPRLEGFPPPRQTIKSQSRPAGASSLPPVLVNTDGHAFVAGSAVPSKEQRPKSAATSRHHRNWKPPSRFHRSTRVEFDGSPLHPLQAAPRLAACRPLSPGLVSTTPASVRLNRRLPPRAGALYPSTEPLLLLLPPRRDTTPACASCWLLHPGGAHLLAPLLARASPNSSAFFLLFLPRLPVCVSSPLSTYHPPPTPSSRPRHSSLPFHHQSASPSARHHHERPRTYLAFSLAGTQSGGSVWKRLHVACTRCVD